MVMTQRKPKQKQEGCPQGTPHHHWKIGSERDVEGFFPGECRNCGSTRRFAGSADPDYMGAYQQYANGVARVVKFKTFRGHGGDDYADSTPHREDS